MDELAQPLIFSRYSRTGRNNLETGLVAGGIVAAITLMSVFLWAALADDRLGGEPYAVVAISQATPVTRTLAVAATDAADLQLSQDTQAQLAASDEGDVSGIGLLRSGEPASGIVIDQPDPTANAAVDTMLAQADNGLITSSREIDDALTDAQLAALDQVGEAIDNGTLTTSAIAKKPTFRKTARPLADLVEPTKYGPLPRLGRNGRRPLDAYARSVQAPSGFGALPRIAILVGGLGISQTATMRAIDNMPAAVTFAFAPYGNSLQRWAERARQKGHEYMLQVPMEPINYPENNPGPHTLLSKAPPQQNAQRMHWLMARVPSYTGIVNYMGARFTQNPHAMASVLQETKKRGLLYLDDGTSTTGTAAMIARQLGAPYARGDLVLDAVPTKRAIRRRLNDLEDLARQRGFAIGIASGLPVSIAELTSWAQNLQGRGFLLVPVSAMARAGGA